MRRCCGGTRTEAEGGACGVAGAGAASPCCCRSASQTVILRAARCVPLLLCRAAPKAVGSSLVVREEKRARIVLQEGMLCLTVLAIACRQPRVCKGVSASAVKWCLLRRTAGTSRRAPPASASFSRRYECLRPLRRVVAVRGARREHARALQQASRGGCSGWMSVSPDTTCRAALGSRQLLEAAMPAMQHEEAGSTACPLRTLSSHSSIS